MTNNLNIIPETNSNENGCDNVENISFGCIPKDTSCIIYNLSPSILTKLVNLEINSGTNLTVILEKIDSYLGSITGFNFTGFSLSCLRDDYTITNIKEFAEAISCEICNLKEITNFISNPNIVSDILSILENDNFETVFNKVITSIENLYINETPDLTKENTNSLELIVSGNKNHHLKGNVKISLAEDNIIEIKNDGIFAKINNTEIINIVNNSTLNITEETINNILNQIINNQDIRNTFCSICSSLDPCEGISVTPNWQDISVPYCDSGVSKKIQQDINKCSNTYNNTRTIVIGSCSNGNTGSTSLNLTINNPTCV